MLIMLDQNKLGLAEAETGMMVEQLLTPLTKYKRVRPGARYAIDNGAFSAWDEKGFLSLLDREWEARDLCRFVAVPDIVGSARRTLEVFAHWAPKLTGWPLALVAQDGQEHLPIPWESIEAIFIGGTNDFKLGRAAEQAVRAAKMLGKWVHVGRVNTPERLEYFERMGADSIDGSGLARFSWMREVICESRKQGQIAL